jgi:hypothetical protein
LPCCASANKVSKKEAMCSALLLGVDVDGLSFGTRRVHGVDAEKFGTKLDECHPLASTRV